MSTKIIILIGVILAALLLAGMAPLAVLSQPPTPATTASPAPLAVLAVPELLSDGQFVYGPNVGDFDVRAYLLSHENPFADQADEIQAACAFASVNPRVVVTLLTLYPELATHFLPRAASCPAGDETPGQRTPIGAFVDRLASRFYDHLYAYGSRHVGPLALDAQRQITLQDGRALAVPATMSAGTYAVLATVAEAVTLDDVEALVSPDRTEGFAATYASLFPDDNPLDTSNDINPTALPPDDMFQFPFPIGATWRFTGAHQSGSNPSEPLSSMDFDLDWPSCDTAPTDAMWAVAAAPGTGSRLWGYSCWYKIVHVGGWQTTYYHIVNVLPDPPRQVAANAPIGQTGCEKCAGGVANGRHVHFTLWYNGAYTSLDGVKLSGWTIRTGNGSYDSGYIERNGVVKPALSEVLNEGIPPVHNYTHHTYLPHIAKD